jgi:hypothetical protein
MAAAVPKRASAHTDTRNGIVVNLAICVRLVFIKCELGEPTSIQFAPAHIYSG